MSNTIAKIQVFPIRTWIYIKSEGKTLGIMYSEVRDIDPAGRVVIPSGVRKHLDLKPGDKVQVYVDKGMVVVRKLDEICTFCNSVVSENEAVLFNNKIICSDCYSKIKTI